MTIEEIKTHLEIIREFPLFKLSADHVELYRGLKAGIFTEEYAVAERDRINNQFNEIWN